MAWASMAGKWECEKSDNLDEFLKAIGVNMMARKMAGSAKPVLEITVEGDKMTVQSKKDTNVFFVNGAETEITLNEKKSKAKCTFVDGKIVIDVSPSADGSVKKAQRITREVRGDQLIQSMEYDGVKCTRYFKRI